MKYTKLGKSDLTVSRICMGCMGFGNAATGQHSWTVDEAQTREIIKRARRLGQFLRHPCRRPAGAEIGYQCLAHVIFTPYKDFPSR